MKALDFGLRSQAERTDMGSTGPRHWKTWLLLGGALSMTGGCHGLKSQLMGISSGTTAASTSSADSGAKHLRLIRMGKPTQGILQGGVHAHHGSSSSDFESENKRPPKPEAPFRLGGDAGSYGQDWSVPGADRPRRHAGG